MEHDSKLCVCNVIKLIILWIFLIILLDYLSYICGNTYGKYLIKLLKLIISAISIFIPIFYSYHLRIILSILVNSLSFLDLLFVIIVVVMFLMTLNMIKEIKRYINKSKLKANDKELRMEFKTEIVPKLKKIPLNDRIKILDNQPQSYLSKLISKDNKQERKMIKSALGPDGYNMILMHELFKNFK